MLTVPLIPLTTGSTASISLKIVVCLAALYFVFGFSAGNVVTAQEDNPTSSNRGAFSLVDHFGHHVTEQTYRGSYLLIFFGYSHCPDICPISLSIFAQVLENLGLMIWDIRLVMCLPIIYLKKLLLNDMINIKIKN